MDCVLIFNLNAILFSEAICGSDIKARFLINFIKIVSLVLLPRAVKQGSVLERDKSTSFHISFVFHDWSRCSKGIVILQIGTMAHIVMQIWC